MGRDHFYQVTLNHKDPRQQIYGVYLSEECWRFDCDEFNGCLEYWYSETSEFFKFTAIELAS